MSEIDSRYDRLARFYKIGTAGVKAFNRANVVILGCGALGAQHAEILTRAGFGRLTLIDRDFVERSNLQRQTLFTEEDAEKALPKVIALKAHLSKINQDIEISTHIADVSSDNIESLIAGHDLLLDGTDNLALRMLINDACYKQGIPWIFGSALESYGMSYNFNFDSDPESSTSLERRDIRSNHQAAPCLRCLLQTLPLESHDTCSSVGVIQPILQMISSIQTTEAMKYFADREAVRETLFSIDLWDFHPQNISLHRLKDPECLTCGPNPTFPALNQKNREAQRLCGDGSVMIREVAPLNLKQLKNRLDQRHIDSQYNEYFLNIHLPSHRVILFADGRGIVYGVTDTEEALQLYNRVVAF
ncbi:thiamine/molybdopterin biosynthesis protein MoeB [Ignatzschineria indica]|uniref:Thiamine biosynthesis protein ThiS n=1 Tax=Ignatzschineria indica TaxID=472583 RepID=A0A2U2AP53_9GAMM|nr:ThiF family adenylyltransferase [Ignatzschineria indica]PWD84982.1 thiamine biosynthesis protein ThiS [Ignatzschineria indica]GGZ80589.1 thiamine/molybdopterin biosynthesis protein MoeB [Ignatzschineria indica]